LSLFAWNQGGIVFDPFCGTGTTALAACKLDRNYVVVDLDSNYVRTASEKLTAMKQTVDLCGTFSFPRQTVKRTKVVISKKEIEVYCTAELFQDHSHYF
jgi:tRNA G10  N-methylase Trm11